MVSYSKFEELLLIGAYIISERSGDDVVSVKKILQTYKIDGNSHWLDRATAGLVSSGYLNDMRTLGAGVEQDLWLSAAGARRAESLMKFQGEPPIGRSNLLDPIEPSPPPIERHGLPAGVSEASGRIFVTEGDAPVDFGGPGDLFVTMAPSSDGLVRFDHNAPEYAEIATGLANVREDVRGLNDSGVDPIERERVLASFDAAQTLWKSTQLKIIQVKVGILMALDDAVKILGKSAKAVAAALLVDTIKSFVKSHTGIDLDNF